MSNPHGTESNETGPVTYEGCGANFCTTMSSSNDNLARPDDKEIYEIAAIYLACIFAAVFLIAVSVDPLSRSVALPLSSFAARKKRPESGFCLDRSRAGFARRRGQLSYVTIFLLSFLGRSVNTIISNRSPSLSPQPVTSNRYRLINYELIR